MDTCMHGSLRGFFEFDRCRKKVVLVLVLVWVEELNWLSLAFTVRLTK